MVSRSEIEFEERLMKEKQGKFIEIVDKASKTLKVKPPKIKFWDGECPQGKPNALAHIHTDKNLICISKRRLKQMTMEEIEHVATHEVTHMLENSHDSNFYIKMDETMQGDWEPKGVIVENENKETRENTKNSREDKTRCNYHLCRKETKLKKCSYCGGYYCKEHYQPKMPLTHEMVANEKDPVLAGVYEEEWRKRGGHPDVIFGERKLNEITAKEKELTDKVMKTLDRMKEIESKKSFKIENASPRVSSKKFSFDVNKQGSTEEWFKEKPPKIKEGWINNPEVKTPKKESRMPTKAIVVVILLIIIGYIFFTYNKEIMNYLSIFQAKGCVANFTKAYESTASFGRDPSVYCQKTCSESYNSTIYRIVEPNQTSKLTVCWCDVNNCNP